MQETNIGHRFESFAGVDDCHRHSGVAHDVPGQVFSCDTHTHAHTHTHLKARSVYNENLSALLEQTDSVFRCLTVFGRVKRDRGRYKYPKQSRGNAGVHTYFPVRSRM